MSKLKGIVRFARIRGKLRPIRISSKPVKTSKSLEKERTFQAFHKDEKIGSLSLRRNKKKATVTHFAVSKKFKGNGVGTALFDRVMDSLSKTKITNLRSESIFSEAATRIRGKHKTTFFTQNGFGRKNPQRLKERKPISFLNRRKMDGRSLNATTLIKKRKK